VLAHLASEGTYNSHASPKSIRAIEKNYRDKGTCKHALMLFGVGDGGGGPGTNHLEYLDRLKDFAGFSPVEQRFARDLFALIQQDSHRYNQWKGELYFEYHRGTYTSQASTKWYNRKLEYGLRELEFAYVLAEKYAGLSFPKQEVDDIWREVLLYQFHDILPGSSIKRVYDECNARYEQLYTRVNELISAAYSSVASGETAFNSLSFPREEYIRHSNAWYKLKLPGMGSAKLEPLPAINSVTADDSALENECLRVIFGQDGTILSVYDKTAKREALAPGTCANRFSVYDDRDGNAWDIQIYYEEQTPRCFTFQSASFEIDGPNAVRTQIFKFGKSTLRQSIVLQAGCPYLTFDTYVDWHESEKMLRTAFDVDVYTDEVTCDIQFGTIKRPTHRNTSWDMTRFEICAHKWIDLSRADYGVALLNDSKYGHRAIGNTMDIALLRSSIHPGVEADQGAHRFRYAFYPHKGDEKAALVEPFALAFNIPPVVVSGTAKTAPPPFLSLSCPNIETVAVKPAEDGDGVILRFYETDGVSTHCKLTLPPGRNRVVATDLMEREVEAMTVRDQDVVLDFGPYEILTLRVKGDYVETA